MRMNAMKSGSMFGCSGLLAACLLALPGCAVWAQEDAALEQARRVLQEGLLFDGHNDLPWAIRNDPQAQGDVAAYDLKGQVAGQTDIARLRAGGVGAQFWSVYIPGEIGSGYARMQLEQIDIARRMIERYPDTLMLATTAAEVRQAREQGRIASVLGMEGGYAIENSLGALRAFHDLGVRYMTLTHNVNLDWADSAAQPPQLGGLSEFGEAVVAEMNRLGMLVDLSHVSDGTMDDVLRVSLAPVIFSHSSARAICDVPRNVPDDILRRLPENGGVVMVTFVAGFIDPEVAKAQAAAREEYQRRAEGKSEAEAERIRAEIYDNLQLPSTTVAKVADHIDHIRKVAGVRHVGIGGDFDGASAWPEGLSDVSMYPNLFAELIRRGWSDEDLKLLAGENVLRVMAQAELISQALQAGD